MTIEQRKLDHLRLVLEDDSVNRQGNHFDRFRLRHQALPELALEDIDLSCTFLGKALQAPLIISSMTGGRDARIQRINQHLAEAAQACGVALAVGSQRIQLEHPDAAHSFQLRQFAPDIPLMSNIGAVQLNYGVGAEDIQQLINTLDADGIYLHLNPLQEAIQPEGNTNFRDLWTKVIGLQSSINRPILLKEVGSGLSPELIQQGLTAGIQYFDLAGQGGTSWSRIEQARHPRQQVADAFLDWGMPTPWLLQQARALAPQTTIIASGGLRHGVDVVKSIVMGARMAGLAAPFLQPALESTKAVIHVIEQIKQDMRISLFLMGQRQLQDVWCQDALLIDLPEGSYR